MSFFQKYKSEIIRWAISSLDTFMASFVAAFMSLLFGLVNIDNLSGLSTSAWIKLLVAITFASCIVAVRNTVKATRESLTKKSHGK